MPVDQRIVRRRLQPLNARTIGKVGFALRGSALRFPRRGMGNGLTSATLPKIAHTSRSRARFGQLFLNRFQPLGDTVQGPAPRQRLVNRPPPNGRAPPVNAQRPARKAARIGRPFKFKNLRFIECANPNPPKSSSPDHANCDIAKTARHNRKKISTDDKKGGMPETFLPFPIRTPRCSPPVLTPRRLTAAKLLSPHHEAAASYHCGCADGSGFAAQHCCGKRSRMTENYSESARRTADLDRDAYRNFGNIAWATAWHGVPVRYCALVPFGSWRGSTLALRFGARLDRYMFQPEGGGARGYTVSGAMAMLWTLPAVAVHRRACSCVNDLTDNGHTSTPPRSLARSLLRIHRAGWNGGKKP